MSPINIVTTYQKGPLFEKSLKGFAGSGLVEDIVVICPEQIQFDIPGCRVLAPGQMTSQETLNAILADIKTDYLLLMPGSGQVLIEPKALERVLEAAKTKRAGIVYSDYHEEGKEGKKLHPLIDYQTGSVRDDFDFGAMMLFSTSAARSAVEKYGAIPTVSFAGLYDLRLKVSIDNPVHHINEPLYSVVESMEDSAGERHFAYVDPKNADVQKEMEVVFTDYLKRIGAYIPPYHLRKAAGSGDRFPVEASVIIPVKNRKGTIADAVKSALSQETDFSFNVIVADNHSEDGTTAVLSSMAGNCPQLLHIIPERTDLGIGGCWNVAINSDACGRYAVQLDSDDLYGSTQILQRIVDMLRKGYAMVIGSYTIVDFDLNIIPPGLIDHREWTDANGHNNALRINGLGAPRAFNTSVIRQSGFLNVSYGEDYSAALQICREYQIGRIYESLYLCRRWPGNTDAGLSLDAANRNNAFKDKVRTDEILARQEMMKGVGDSMGRRIE